MSSKSTIITLNGKSYDAATGKQINHHAGPAAAKPGSGFRKAKHSSIDGFKHPNPSHNLSGKPALLAVKGPVTTSHHIHKNTQHSSTLMRRLVKKPAHRPASPARFDKIASAGGSAAAITLNPSLGIDRERLERAKQVAKSAWVSKFNAVTGFSRVTALLPVKQPPETASTDLDDLDEALANAEDNDLLTAALAKADSHTNKPLRKTRLRHKIAKKIRLSPRALNISLMVLSVAVLGSFIVYQNMPRLAMRLAVARSGVKGSLPDYQPTGYTIAGPIQYSPGVITINYQSKTENRNFKVLQHASDWNSETLLQNFVATDNKMYQTYQENGKTIYLYEGENATWVDGGVWYEIQTDSALTNNQVIRLANSL